LLWFGKRSGKSVNLLYLSGFALQRLLGVSLLAQHEIRRKADYDAEHSGKSDVEQAEGDSVRFAELTWHPIVYHSCPRYRECHGQQNDYSVFQLF
jgi:hypothetical protein